MIISRVDEDVWRTALSELPFWTPAFGPLLVVAPHPDDETLGAGGLIAAQQRRRDGHEITIVCVTDGENAYGRDDRAELAAVRQAEQTAALDKLGLGPEHMLRLRMVDSNVAEGEQELADRLTQLATAETTIMAPWVGDFHPDHEACGRAAAVAAERTGARLVSYFFWTWHRGVPEDLAGLKLVKFALNDDLLQAKDEALRQHVSQLSHSNGEPILPERLLGPARRPYEVFAVR
jgi:LmbE family N-acetylglucosaminyl deacetylase